MTYCCGILLKDGLVMIADTRTNAGVDDISVYRKLHLIQAPDRFFAVATAGNLSVTQSALADLTQGVELCEGEKVESLYEVGDMYRAARMIGEATATVKRRIARAIEPDISAGVTLLFGGQIRGGPMRFFLIYDEGNFIECGRDMPFLQAGETKYGKPILLRSLSFETDLYEALKVGLVSFDSTLRSNLAVGLPLDAMVLRRDAFLPELSYRIREDDGYFRDLGERWSGALKAAIADIPPPPYRPG